MSHHILSRLRNLKPTMFIATLLGAFLLLLSGVVGTAQSPAQESTAQPSARERVWEDRIPKHLPIKVKVKNINNEK